MTQQLLRDNTAICFDSLLSLGEQLDESQWATQSLCPDWTVAGVFAHLAAIEKALLEIDEPSVDTPLDFAAIGADMAEWVTWSGADLLAETRRIFDARKAQLASLDDSVFEAPSWTPVGAQTYGRFMAVRVFDLWVHEQDIRVPLGIPGHLDGPAAEMALDEVHRSLGYIIGKKVGLADGQSIALHVTGDAGRNMYVAVDGRAGVVDRLEAPTASLTVDHQAFLLLACGRVDPQAIIDEGRVESDGDSELGERASRNLAFTM